jgi:GT2 family glycosyltransferase
VPESIAYHKGMASFKKSFTYKGTFILSYRNTFLFIWKNITDFRFLLEHILFLFPWIIFSAIKLNPNFISGFIQAIPRFREAISRRRKEATYFRESDKKLFDLLGCKRLAL